MKYRLYIDEVGNSDLKSSYNSNHRYLSLIGVIIELDYVSTENLEISKYYKSLRGKIDGWGRKWLP